MGTSLPGPVTFSPELLAAAAAQLYLFDPIRREIAVHQAAPIAAELADWRGGLLAQRDGGRHVRDTVRRARKMCRLCRAGCAARIQKAAIRLALGKLLAPRPRRANVGLATANHYLNSLKAFLNWLVDNDRADRSSAHGIRPFSAAADVRRKRRALAAAEVLALIAAANAGPAIAGIPGAERAIMYLLAATTGLRAGELESLTAASFRLGAEPAVTISAAFAKNGRTDTLPLRADVAYLVERFLAGREPSPGPCAGRASGACPPPGRLFRRPAGNGTRALRADLAAAGIAYRDERGEYADFHSLRHTFVTNLFDRGASPKEAQTLARHADARLTLARYAHCTDSARRAAVERLPAASEDHDE